MRRLVFFPLLCFMLQSSFGQTRTVRDFSLINAADQSTISLSKFKTAKGIVVIFTSNSCPYSKLYESRILNLHETYSQKGLKLLLINPNNPVVSPDDEVSMMKSKAKTRNYSFPYLADTDQEVSKIFGASKTPEAFLLKPNGSQYHIVYHGSIDDNPQNGSDVSDPYLIKAIEKYPSDRPHISKVV